MGRQSPFQTDIQKLGNLGRAVLWIGNMYFCIERNSAEVALFLEIRHVGLVEEELHFDISDLDGIAIGELVTLRTDRFIIDERGGVPFQV